MITCKLTGKIGKAIKAHVVPRAFYELQPQEGAPCLLVSNAPKSFPKKLPVGIYDKTMVTLNGENIFKPWDDYAIQTLLKNEDAFERFTQGGVVLGWTLPKYEYSPRWKVTKTSRNPFTWTQSGAE